jgi:aldehyde dehydrogenase (NAD+)
MRIASKLEAGTVGVNSAFATNVQTPFGGFKQSGIGRESGKEALNEYVQPKTIHINLNLKPKQRL